MLGGCWRWRWAHGHGSSAAADPRAAPPRPQILTLVQLRKLGSRFPVPVILANYDGFWSSLMQFLGTCDRSGTVGARELSQLVSGDGGRAGRPWMGGGG